MAKALPMARQDGLAMEQVHDELLVYDLDRDKAYCLNPMAAQVWKRCDGRTAPADMAKALQKDIGAPVDEKVVWYALDQLGRDRLLQEKLALPAALAGMTRRQHLRALGKVAAVAVPLVTAVMAPTPALAATCVMNHAGCTPNGTSCSTNEQCCSCKCNLGSGNPKCTT
jgi:hypothetical protein